MEGTTYKAKAALIAGLDRILPRRAKDALFHLSFNLARGEFEKFAYEYSFAPNMKLGLIALAKRGFSPRTIIDVGAFEGHWSSLVRLIWPASRLIMIEPNYEKEHILTQKARDLGAELHLDLLGSEDGRSVVFNIMGSGSSVMSERSTIPRHTEKRQLRTLDSLIERIDPPALLKIDAQGYELEILKGASGMLPHFECVLLEVAIIEINMGAPLLHDVVTFMKNLGFVTYDILELHRRPLDRALNQVDVLFVREEAKLLQDKRHFA